MTMARFAVQFAAFFRKRRNRARMDRSRAYGVDKKGYIFVLRRVKSVRTKKPYSSFHSHPQL